MDGSLPPAVQDAINTGFYHLLINKYYVLASTVMLIYDHMLTIEQERKYIWNYKRSFPTFLFFIFRYVTPVVSIINLAAEHDPTWVGHRCSRWIWMPVAMGPIISAATGVILILRVYAIYHQARWILLITIPVYLGQLGVMAWSIPAGVPAPLPPGFIGCVPSEKPGTGIRLSSIYIAALVFDATVFALTFGRAIYMRMTKSTLSLAEVIIRDGTLYFVVIFAVNLANVFIFSLAPVDLGALNAPFASMITTVLVARLVMNLREAGSKTQVSTDPSSGAESIGTWDASLWRSEDADTSTWMGKPISDRTATTLDEMLGLNEFNVSLGVIENEKNAEGRAAAGFRSPPIHDEEGASVK